VTIRLDVLRHGRAEPAAEAGDAARVLTAAGAAELRQLAARLALERWRVDRAFVSPLLRARQTAELVLGERPTAELVTLPELDPDADPETLGAALEALVEPGRSALVVGHLPLLGRFARWLTHEVVAFAPGTMATIACEHRIVAGAGRIERLFEPPDYR